jgi:hypothetical protein
MKTTGAGAPICLQLRAFISIKRYLRPLSSLIGPAVPLQEELVTHTAGGENKVEFFKFCRINNALLIPPGTANS